MTDTTDGWATLAVALAAGAEIRTGLQTGITTRELRALTDVLAEKATEWKRILDDELDGDPPQPKLGIVDDAETPVGFAYMCSDPDASTELLSGPILSKAELSELTGIPASLIADPYDDEDDEGQDEDGEAGQP
jgi:hypothetical protein